MSHSKLDRAAIVNEALLLLDEQGLACVSLRKIAARLDVTVSSLYWHIRDRDQLLELMSETVFRGCVEATPEAESWDGWLHNFAMVLWATQVGVRDCQKLIVVSSQDQGGYETLQDAVVARLAAHGVERGQGMVMQMSVQALVTGWSTLDRGPGARQEFEIALSALLQGWRDGVTQ